MNTIYSIGTSSASHTYGNVMSCFKMMMDELFPEHFITHTYIDSKLAWKMSRKFWETPIESSRSGTILS